MTIQQRPPRPVHNREARRLAMVEQLKTKHPKLTTGAKLWSHQTYREATEAALYASLRATTPEIPENGVKVRVHR